MRKANPWSALVVHVASSPFDNHAEYMYFIFAPFSFLSGNILARGLKYSLKSYKGPELRLSDQPAMIRLQNVSAACHPDYYQPATCNSKCSVRAPPTVDNLLLAGGLAVHFQPLSNCSSSDFGEFGMAAAFVR